MHIDQSSLADLHSLQRQRLVAHLLHSRDVDGSHSTLSPESTGRCRHDTDRDECCLHNSHLLHEAGRLLPAAVVLNLVDQPLASRPRQAIRFGTDNPLLIEIG